MSANDVDNGYLKIKNGVTKKFNVLQALNKIDPTIVVDEKAGTELLLYGDGVFLLFDKQGTLIKHKL